MSPGGRLRRPRLRVDSRHWLGWGPATVARLRSPYPNPRESHPRSWLSEVCHALPMHQQEWFCCTSMDERACFP